MTGPLFQMADCSVMIDGKTIVENISFTATGGELVVIAGPNGAGKSTLMRAIAGLARCSGKIYFDDVSLTGLSREARARLVAYLPQGHEVNWPLSVRDIVALGRLPHGRGSLTGLSEIHESIVMEAIRSAGIEDLALRSYDKLSGGEQALVMLARALAGQPKLLLADEPIAHLDIEHKLEVMELLKATAKSGTLVICILHDLETAARFSDKVLLLDRGVQDGFGEPNDVLREGTIRRVYHVRRGKDKKSVFGGYWARI